MKKYQVSLIYVTEAESEKEAKKLAMKYIQVAEAKIEVVSPFQIFEAMKDIRAEAKEHFCAFIMDTRQKIIAREIVSIGTLNASLVHARETFRKAIELNAAFIILSHNHPSGSLEPSEEDILTTRRLQDAGKILGIEVIDHVICTKEGYKSLRENRLI